MWTGLVLSCVLKIRSKHTRHRKWPFPRYVCARQQLSALSLLIPTAALNCTSLGRHWCARLSSRESILPGSPAKMEGYIILNMKVND